jgi:hypothetical protein
VLILQAGIYGTDWSTFGAFVAAPFGSLLWTAIGFAVRAAWIVVRAKQRGEPRPNVWQKRIVDTARFVTEAERAGVYNREAEHSTGLGSVEHGEDDDRKVVQPAPGA